MLFSFVGVKLKQTIGGEGIRGVFKFLAPDLLVGAFLAVSAIDSLTGHSLGRLFLVSSGVALFTMVVETRKIFFSGGDVEAFYFVQPNLVFRFSTLLAVLTLDLLVTVSVAAPFTLLNRHAYSNPGEVFGVVIASLLASITGFFALAFTLSVTKKSLTNMLLTFFQIAMAMLLVATFQLSMDVKSDFDMHALRSMIGPLAFVLAVLITVTPVLEKLQDRLSSSDMRGRFDLVRFTSFAKMLLRLRDNEERAGFIMCVSNLLRNSSFRLSTIAVSITPIVVAVYWAFRHVRFITVEAFYGLVTAETVAPFASVVVSGILAHYFMAQGLIGSRDSEASWYIRICSPFDAGRYMKGFRKAMFIFIQLPTSILVFLVIFLRNELIDSLLAGLTYFSVTQISLTWFSLMQRHLPFSVPFARIAHTEGLNLVFMFVFSFLTAAALLFALRYPSGLLMLNLFAFILLTLLGFLADKIVNRRIGSIG